MRISWLLGAVGIGAGLCVATIVRAGTGADKGKQRGWVPAQFAPKGPIQVQPAPFTTSADVCVTAGLDPSVFPAGLRPTNPFGSDFDPSKFTEISVAGNGRMLAFATNIAADGATPSAMKRVVIQPLGADPVSVATTDADEPSLQLDDFGYRCAFRSGASAGISNVQLYQFTRTIATGTHGAGGAGTSKTTAITTGTSHASFDPALAARTRVRDILSGVTFKERDARIAFISSDDLDPGTNPAHHEQLFLWEELSTPAIRQLTRNTDATAKLNRPSIAKSGTIVFFECTANLDPGSADPLDSSRVGNPNHRRQIYRWRDGTGIDQITWTTDGDCYSPRAEIDGRFVVFSSNGDPAANRDPADPRYFEIFRWTSRGRRLRQMTSRLSAGAGGAGDSGFPRPTSDANVFAFYSTARPPMVRNVGEPFDAATNPILAFGAAGLEPEGPHEPHLCVPQAMLYDHGRISVIDALALDDASFHRITRSQSEATVAQRFPVFTGPPAPRPDGSSVYFATDDYRLNAPLPKGSTAPKDAVPTLTIPGIATPVPLFYLATAAPRAR